MKTLYLIVVIYFNLFCVQESSSTENPKEVDGFKLPMNNGIKPDSTLIVVYNNLGAQYAHSNSKLAKNYLNKSVEISKKYANLEEQNKAYSMLLKISEREGNIIKSLEYLKKVMLLKDSILEKEKRTHSLALKEQTSRLNLLKSEQKAIKLNRSLVMTIIFLIVIISGFGLYNNREKSLKIKLLMENSVLEKEKLTAELTFKRKELVTNSLHITKKNIALEKLKKNIEKLSEKKDNTSTDDYNQLLQIISKELKDDKESWADFKNYFEKVHPNFYVTVKDKYPKVTSGELRLMALIRMNLSYKEIGGILNVTNEGIKKARYRLRKKLEITPQDSLQEIINNI